MAGGSIFFRHLNSLGRWSERHPFSVSGCRSFLLSFSCGRRGIRKQLVKLEKADSQIVIHDLPEPRKVFMIFAMAESFVSGAELATALRAEGFRVLVRGRFRGFYR